VRTIPQRRTRSHEAASQVREEKAMPHTYPLIEAVRVTPFADRFVFRAPNSRLLDPAHQYLANEIQKVEIIATMITHRPALKLAVLALVLLMWVGALAALVSWFGAGRDNPTPGDLIVMTVLIFAPMVMRTGCGGRGGRRVGGDRS
jgi:hypothetical protein